MLRILHLFFEILLSSEQLQNSFYLRKWTQTPFQYSMNICDHHSIVCNRDSLILCATDPVFHFAFIQHTAAAVHNKGIRRKIFGKSAAGGKLEFKVLAGVFADPRGQLHGADIAALAVMRAAGADAAGGVMHCFTESWEVASAALDLGFYLSFSGIVTFKSASALKDVARKVPLDRLLIETDSPYLAPVPHRGKTNEPAYVRQVAAQIAELRGLSLEAVAEASTNNFFTLFAKAPRGR